MAQCRHELGRQFALQPDVGEQLAIEGLGANGRGRAGRLRGAGTRRLGTVGSQATERGRRPQAARLAPPRVGGGVVHGPGTHGAGLVEDRQALRVTGRCGRGCGRVLPTHEAREVGIQHAPQRARQAAAGAGDIRCRRCRLGFEQAFAVQPQGRCGQCRRRPRHQNRARQLREAPVPCLHGQRQLFAGQRVAGRHALSGHHGAGHGLGHVKPGLRHMARPLCTHTFAQVLVAHAHQRTQASHGGHRQAQAAAAHCATRLCLRQHVDAAPGQHRLHMQGAQRECQVQQGSQMGHGAVAEQAYRQAGQGQHGADAAHAEHHLGRHHHTAKATHRCQPSDAGGHGRAQGGAQAGHGSSGEHGQHHDHQRQPPRAAPQRADERQHVVARALQREPVLNARTAQPLPGGVAQAPAAGAGAVDQPAHAGHVGAAGVQRVEHGTQAILRVRRQHLRQPGQRAYQFAGNQAGGQRRDTAHHE